MDDYDEFDLQSGANLVLKSLIGFFVVAALATIFTLTLSFQATNKFFEVIMQIIYLGVPIHPILVFALNVTLTTLVSPIAYIWAQSPELMGINLEGVNLEAGLISSIICYIVAGIVVGIITKKDWLMGLQAGIIVVALAYLFSFALVILSLILANALFAGLATIITLGLYISVTFVMSIITFLICGVSGILGGFIYQRFLKNRNL
ncbi:MAG: hypothetical protein EAX96_03825 [Candidatus Lokiarchaeota archaeon]|nr:hypothetical protein [Candidatus Lokiarchaeota archaeon]